MPSLYRKWEDSAKEHQRVFFDLDRYTDDGPDTPKLVAGIVTGYGGGKTWAGVRKAFQLAIENAPIPVLCVEPTYQMISDILVPEFYSLFDEYGINYVHNQQRNEIVIPYLRIEGRNYYCGAKIWMRSGDKPQRLKGPNIAAAWIDEPFIQDREVYKQILARVRHPKSRNKMILVTGTPEGLGWGFDEFVKNAKLTTSFDVDVRGVPVRVDVFTGENLTWINCSSEINIDSLGQNYFDDIRRTHTALESGSYIGGAFQNLSQGRVYYAYAEANDRAFDLSPSFPVIVTCDFNSTEAPMSWNVCQVRDDGVYVRYALHKQYTHTREMCSVLEDRLVQSFGSLPRYIEFYGDYAGYHSTSNSSESDWEIIRSYFRNKCEIKIDARPCKSIRQSAAAVNALLCNANNERKLYLYPGEDTEHLRLDFQLVTWKEGGTKEDDKDPMRTHAAAAMRYYAEVKHPVRSKPQYY